MHEQTDETEELTAGEIEELFAWLPFDWRRLLRAWILGYGASVGLVLWFLVFIAGPLV